MSQTSTHNIDNWNLFSEIKKYNIRQWILYIEKGGGVGSEEFVLPYTFWNAPILA